MGRLGDVLEAIYEAPRLEGALHARAFQVQDATKVEAVHEWWNQRSPHGRSSGLLIAVSSSGNAPASRAETDHELWWAARDRWRTQCGNRVYAFADGAFATWSPETEGVRDLKPDAPLPAWDPILHPRWIHDWFEASVGRDQEVAGRPCWQVSLRPTDEPPLFRSGMPRWYGNEIECAIDQETGVALSYVARYEGQAVDSWTTTRFEPVAAIEPSVFAFTPPDGSGFRDPRQVAHESMLRSAAVAGVDLSEVDTTDHEAVMRAFMQQQRGGFGPIDAAAQAEQYVATGPPPADANSAEVAVRDVFERLVTASEDGTAVPAVQGGENLGPSLAEAGQRAPGGTHPATVRVELVKFLNADEAVAWFRLERAEIHLFGPIVGRARRIDGHWLVTRETFAQLVGSTGVHCPPPP